MSNASQNQFAEAFPQEAAAIAEAVAAGVKGGHSSPVGVHVGGGRGYQDPSRLAGVSRTNYERFKELQDSLSETVIEPATITNLCPFALKVYGGALFEGLDVPACPVDQPFVTYVIRNWRPAWKDGIDGERSPTPYYPIKLAREFEHQYEKVGGVFVFQGTEDPAKDPKLKKFVTDAREKLAVYMLRLVHEADAEMRRPGGPRITIGEQHRVAAVWCFTWKKIAQLPNWLEMTPEEANLAAACPACGYEGKKSAAICKDCKYVLDPMRAYIELALIGPDDPCLQRLTRKQLDSIGLKEIPSRADEIAKLKSDKK